MTDCKERIDLQWTLVRDAACDQKGQWTEGGHIDMLNAQRSKEESLTLIEEAAHNYEKNHHGCSRSALMALQDHLNLGNGLIFRASNPAGSG
jgi:hypothetical protein